MPNPKASRTVYRLKHGTTLEQLPGSILLFSERDQQIHALNETSRALVEQLRSGAAEDELVDELLGNGVEREEAVRWVCHFLEEAAGSGLLIADHAATRTFEGAQRLKIAGRQISLRYGSSDLRRLIEPAFAHLEAGEEVDEEDWATFELIDEGALVSIASGGRDPLLTPRAAVAVRLKGFVLDRVLDAPRHVAALHAALLERDGHGVLLLGSPGAGKTTLALQLMRQGFRYGSDDVTLLNQDGVVEGVPLAPAVKEAAWSLVGSIGLADLPIHVRPDGQRVRYLPLDKEALGKPCRVTAVLRLSRGNGSARLEPIFAQDGFADLFRESRTADGRCSAEIVHAFADIVRTAACLDLSYSDAAEAAALLSAQIPR